MKGKLELLYPRSTETDLPSLTSQRHKNQARLLSPCHHVAIFCNDQPVTAITQSEPDSYNTKLEQIQFFFYIACLFHTIILQGWFLIMDSSTLIKTAYLYKFFFCFNCFFRHIQRPPECDRMLHKQTDCLSLKTLVPGYTVVSLNSILFPCCINMHT